MLSNGRFAGFNSHPRLEGSHAFLSPSSPAWLRYDDDKLLERLTTAEASAKGTRLHETAARCIMDGIELQEDGRYPILAAYVNDAIELEMVPEQTLFYSFNCYGTTDAIAFEEYIDATSNGPKGFLRIHDLKTGVTKASEDQLYIYAALFCLEYGYLPFEIEGELRIYQSDPVKCHSLDRPYLASVYEKIKSWNEVIESRRKGGRF